MALLDPELVQKRGHVVDPGFHRVSLLRPITLPVAAMVEIDHGEVVLHVRGDERVALVPVDRPADLDDRRPAPIDLVIDVDPVDLRKRHERYPPSGSWP